MRLLSVVHAALVAGLLPQTDPPTDGSGLVSAFTDSIALNTPYIVGAIGAVIGLVFLIALGAFIVRRVRGSVK